MIGAIGLAMAAAAMGADAVRGVVGEEEDDPELVRCNTLRREHGMPDWVPPDVEELLESLGVRPLPTKDFHIKLLVVHDSMHDTRVHVLLYMYDANIDMWCDKVSLYHEIYWQCNLELTLELARKKAGEIARDFRLVVQEDITPTVGESER